MKSDATGQPLSFFERLFWAPVFVALLLWFAVRGACAFVFCSDARVFIALIAAVQFVQEKETAATPPPTKGPQT